MAKMNAGNGPDVDHRTLRKRAREIGTSASGFNTGVPNVDPSTGTPDSMAGGTYKDAAASATPVEAPSAQPQGTPFRTTR